MLGLGYIGLPTAVTIASRDIQVQGVDIQEQIIKQIYPNNYQDHLYNRDHISEKNEFQWINNDKPLVIDSGKETLFSVIESINKIYIYSK